MKFNKLFLMISVLFFLAGIGHTEDSGTKPKPVTAQRMNQWMARMEAKINRIESKPQKTTTGVAAVRGDKAADKNKTLYWKGRSSSKPVTEEELNAFKSALAKMNEGNFDSASTELKQFLEKYPSSSINPDINTALKLLTEQSSQTEPQTEP